MAAWVSTPGWCWLAYGAVYSWSHPSLAHAWRCLASGCIQVVPCLPAAPIQPCVSLGRHLAAAVAAALGRGGPLGGVTGALAPLDGLEGPDGSLAVAFMDGPDGPINGLAGLGGRPGQVHLEHLVALCLEVAWAMYMDVLEVAWVAWGMVHLVALVLAALMGPFHGGSSPGDLTVWMPLATGEPGGTELGGNLGVKPPWLVLTGCALAACQYNAAGALTKRKINQPLRLLAGQVAMAPAGDVRYMTNEYYITMSNGLGILGNSWSWRLLLGIHNWLLLGNSWANLPAQTKQKN